MAKITKKSPSGNGATAHTSPAPLAKPEPAKTTPIAAIAAAPSKPAATATARPVAATAQPAPSPTQAQPKPAYPAQPKPSAPQAPAKPAAPSAERVSLELVKPDAKQVCVAGDFNGWKPETTPLTLASNGRWVGNVPMKPGRHEYLFVVDGQWLPDPNAKETVQNPFGGKNSVVIVSA
jgi:hypothetical protein